MGHWVMEQETRSGIRTVSAYPTRGGHQQSRERPMLGLQERLGDKRGRNRQTALRVSEGR